MWNKENKENDLRYIIFFWNPNKEDGNENSFHISLITTSRLLAN